MALFLSVGLFLGMRPGVKTGEKVVTQSIKVTIIIPNIKKITSEKRIIYYEKRKNSKVKIVRLFRE